MLSILNTPAAGNGESRKGLGGAAEKASRREQNYRHIESLREETVLQYILTCR